MATIATSIMPKRIEVQQAAIKSWLNLGFNVISVNVKSEIAVLPHLFPGVVFLHATKEPLTSPLIPISELWVALAKCESKLNGIVNSDVILSTHEDFIAFLMQKTENNTLLFGSRIEIDDICSRFGTPTGLGYDYFFFSKDLLCFPISEEFCLGAPWWDYWFPVTLAIKGAILLHLIIPVGFHLRHEQVWNDADLELGRKKFICEIGKALIENDRNSAICEEFKTIIKVQGIESFATQISSILWLDSKHVGPQSIPLESLSTVGEIFKIHRERYQAILKSRSWRWSAPIRFISAHLRNFSNKLQKTFQKAEF